MAPSKLPKLPPRRHDAHKGDFGRILIVAGSRGMSGAAALAATAAYRGGAGLVYVAVPESLLPVLSVQQLCAVGLRLPELDGALGQGAADEVARLEERADVLVLGPGLGTSRATIEEARRIVSRTKRPLVLDADGINAFAGQAELLRGTAMPRILTPHPGELARLIGEPAEAINRHRVRVAEAFAHRYGGVLVLKGHGTVVTDGQRTFVNPTGNPGMASGGSGDVLSGLIGALLGQGLDPFEASQLGAYLHGLAGDLAAREVGQVSLMASDLLRYLPAAILQHQGGNP